MSQLPARTSIYGLIALINLLLLISCAAPDTPARGSSATPSPTRSAVAPTPPSLGIQIRDVPGGVYVVDTINGSLAQQEGIHPHDTIMELNRQTIPSAEWFSRMVGSRSPSVPMSLRVKRGDAQWYIVIPASQPPAAAAANRNIDYSSPRARRFRMPVQDAPVTDPFQVPGLAPRAQGATGINVLQRVFLDPATGQLAFVGHYDPAYATGAIDYSTLLHDALRSPAPVFSLEPTPATKAAVVRFVADFDRQMAASLSSVSAFRAWFGRMIDLLLHDPALGADRQRFLQKGADILKVTPAEVPDLTRTMLNRAQTGSPLFVKFWAKFYESAGVPELSAWIRFGANKEANPDAFLDTIAWLGLEPRRLELRALVEAGRITTERGEALFEVAMWKENFRRMRVPENRWAAAAERAERTGNMTPFRELVSQVNAEILRERLLEPWLDGLVLSEAFLSRFNRMPPLDTMPVFRGGLAPESELAHIFLEADWTLKMLGEQPELAKRVAGHRTPHQYLFERETEAGYYETGGIEMRFWLSPGSVAISHDPAHRVLAFDRATVKVDAELLARHGGTGTGDPVTRSALTAYASEVTRRYDDYAKALPELHRLREAAKLLALVRWTRTQGINLVPPEPAVTTQNIPERFDRGFWTARFHSANGRTFLGLAASGGIDFSEQDGATWIEPSVDPALGRSATGQLMASAALGREAAAAAISGDLESARQLAEQSAQAMTGQFDFTGHPALGKIPEPPEPVAVALLQNETAIQTRQAIETLANPVVSEPQKVQAKAHLQQIKTVLDEPAPSYQQARQWVQLLRNGEWDSLSLSLSRSATTTRPQTPAPTPFPVATTASHEQIAIRREITDLRQELCRVQANLRRFNATIQADAQLRGEWEAVTNEAYQSALNRAKAKLADFSVDFPEGKLEDRLGTLRSPEERARVERALRMVQHLKESYQLKDFSTWAAHEDYGREEIMEGIATVADLIGIEDAIKDHLVKRWGLGRVLAFKDAASDLVASTYDVTAEVVAWRRLAQLNRNSDAFLVAVRKLSERQRYVLAQIHEREVRLGLQAGTTKTPCE